MARWRLTEESAVTTLDDIEVNADVDGEIEAKVGHGRKAVA